MKQPEPRGWRHRLHWYWFFFFLHPHHHFFVIFTAGPVSYLLRPERTIHAMPATFNVGQTLPLSISFLDQNGHPMVVTPTPDAPPVWADGNPAVDALTAAANGLTANDLGVAPGADTVTVTLAVAGVSFSASLPVTVAAAPQVLTSIEIVPGTPTP